MLNRLPGVGLCALFGIGLMTCSVREASGYAMLVAAYSRSGSARAQDPKLDRILSSMETAARTIKSLQTDISQVKHFGSIGGPDDKVTAKLYFRHEKDNHDKIRIHYDTGNDVLIQGEQIELYNPKTHQLIKTSRQKQAATSDELSFIATPYASMPQLKSKYTVVLLRDEQEGRVSVLELTPKGKSSTSKVTLWVNHETWLLEKTLILEQNRDVLTYTLSNVVRNGKLPADAFKLDVPHGTNRVNR
jgi:outer membrane lipoprotein-sorting protein